MSSHHRDRAHRRTETHRICSERHRQWMSFGWDRGEAHRFAKCHGGCNCSKHRHGNPRVSGGLCGMGQRDRIYIWRRLTKEIDLAIRQGADPYGDYVALLDQTCDFPNFML